MVVKICRAVEWCEFVGDGELGQNSSDAMLVQSLGSRRSGSSRKCLRNQPHRLVPYFLLHVVPTKNNSTRSWGELGTVESQVVSVVRTKRSRRDIGDGAFEIAAWLQ